MNDFTKISAKSQIFNGCHLFYFRADFFCCNVFAFRDLYLSAFFLSFYFTEPVFYVVIFAEQFLSCFCFRIRIFYFVELSTFSIYIYNTSSSRRSSLPCEYTSSRRSSSVLYCWTKKKQP